jgi:hypothetical protein
MSDNGYTLTSEKLVRRHADLNTEREEIGTEWETLKGHLRQSWPRKRHRLLFVIHEGAQKIDDEEATDLITEINLLDKSVPLDVILHTHGGYLSACDRIAEALVRRPRTAAFVPFYAMSGGTKIALATRQIFFGSGANLGPTDVQYMGSPALDIIQTAREEGDAASEQLKFAAREVRRVLKEESKKACRLINRRHKGFFGGCSLAQNLTSGERYHGARITYAEARKLKIKVSDKLPKVLYEFIAKRRPQLRRLQELESAVKVITASIGDRAPAQDAANAPAVGPFFPLAKRAVEWMKTIQ